MNTDEDPGFTEDIQGILYSNPVLHTDEDGQSYVRMYRQDGRYHEWTLEEARKLHTQLGEDILITEAEAAMHGVSRDVMTVRVDLPRWRTSDE